MSEPTAEPPQVTATVSPAPPPRSRWGAIPQNLGRARTSTVVLSLLFLAVGALWVNVRPDAEDPPATVPAVVDTPILPGVPLPTEESTVPEPAPTTAPPPTATTEAPTTSPSDVPSSTTSSTAAPTTTTPTSEPPAPLQSTTSTPPG